MCIIAHWQMQSMKPYMILFLWYDELIYLAANLLCRVVRTCMFCVLSANMQENITGYRHTCTSSSIDLLCLSHKRNDTKHIEIRYLWWFVEYLDYGYVTKRADKQWLLISEHSVMGCGSSIAGEITRCRLNYTRIRNCRSIYRKAKNVFGVFVLLVTDKEF